jgi:hypothetical protein
MPRHRLIPLCYCPARRATAGASASIIKLDRTARLVVERRSGQDLGAVGTDGAELALGGQQRVDEPVEPPCGEREAEHDGGRKANLGERSFQHGPSHYSLCEDRPQADSVHQVTALARGRRLILNQPEPDGGARG